LIAHGVKVPSPGTERLVVWHISTYVMETAAMKVEAGHACLNVSNWGPPNWRRQTPSNSTESYRQCNEEII